ncbi:MAG: oligosaccharide flippase family protein [Lachnospiraceae bacterium]|nr:oligosaccharide flippase family protein [Lachnospiraceae bacterium]
MSKTKTDEHSKKALKAGVWYTASSFLRKGIGVFSTPIFARLLTKGELGLQNNFVVWFSMAAVVCTLNLKSSVSRAKFDYKDRFDEYLSCITFLGSIATMFFYAIVVMFKDFFVSLWQLDMIYIHLMFIELLVAPSLDILQAKHRIQQKYKVQVGISVFLSVASTFLAVLAVFLCKDKLFGRIMGEAIVNIVVYILVFVYVMYKGKKLVDVKIWKYAMAYSIPLIPHLVANNILGGADKMMITRICGKEANGMYSISYVGGTIISTLMTCFNSAMVPWLFEKLHAKDYKIIKKVNRFYVAGFSIMVIGAILLAPEIMMFFGGKKYAGAEMLVPPVMLGYGFKFAYTNYVNVEQFNKKTGMVSLGTGIAAVFNIITNFIFIPIYGYRAAAYTTLAAFVLLYFLHYYICRKYGFVDMYDNKFFLGVLIVMLIGGLLLQGLYPYRLIRFALAFIVGVISLVGIWNVKKKYF